MPNRSAIHFVGLFILFTGSLTALASASSGNAADAFAKVDLVSEQDAIVPGKQFWLGIRFDLQEGWHTYWVNPGDAGEAPRIEWDLPPGFQAGAIQWPCPTRLSTPPFADYGYERQVLFMIALQPPAQLKIGGNPTIAAHVRYLICRDVCIPGQKQFELTLPVKAGAAQASAGPLFAATREKIPEPAPSSWKISAASVGDEFLLNLKTGKSAGSAQFFPLEAEQIENAAPQPATLIPGGIRLHLKKSSHLLKPISRLKGVVTVGAEGAYLVDTSVSQSSEHQLSSKPAGGGEP